MKDGNRHAYLIMAHHRPDVLRELLGALDDPANDIYLHIDKKSRGDMEESLPGLTESVREGRLTIIPSMTVNWGGYSQIECEMRLLGAAVDDGPHLYYHMMTGATFPLRSQEDIHAFFEENRGRLFIDFDDFEQTECYERVRYRWLFNEAGKDLPKDCIRGRLRDLSVRAQRRAGADRFARFGLELKKGLAYWSVTREAAEYLVSQKDLIRRAFRRSVTGDELFVQTIIYNSPLREKAFDDQGCCHGARRLTSWPIENAGEKRVNHCFEIRDLDMIRGSGDLFGLKFDGPDGSGLIAAIREDWENHA